MRGRSAAGASARWARRSTRSAVSSGFSFVLVWFADSPASSANAAVKGPVPAAWMASSRGARIGCGRGPR